MSTSPREQSLKHGHHPGHYRKRQPLVGLQNILTVSIITVISWMQIKLNSHEDMFTLAIESCAFSYYYFVELSMIAERGNGVVLPPIKAWDVIVGRA
jgi:hypothetical protein